MISAALKAAIDHALKVKGPDPEATVGWLRMMADHDTALRTELAAVGAARVIAEALEGRKDDDSI